MKLLCKIGLLLVINNPLVVNADPLSSWNENPQKKAIIEFVNASTKQGSPTFVPEPERIAVFDNDGTLWAEQPLYFQLLFTIDRVKALAPQHPEWKQKEPFKSVLAGNLKTALADKKNLAALVLATHSGMTTEEFSTTVSNWIKSARHPQTGRLYTQMVFQPMLELLQYLRANGFKTYIVSGGGIEFMRPWIEKIYGIPPEQIIGSRGKLKYEMRKNAPVLVKLPEIDFIDDGPGKPVGIEQTIGRRPLMAFGNSDGDLEMLQWVCSAPGRRFCAYVRHTDAAREWAYDRNSHIGKLDKGLEAAKNMHWTVVSMKDDWRTIFAD